MPPVGGISAPGEETRPFSVFVGGFAGTDSNILRARAYSEEADTFTELLGGMALVLGGEDRKFDLHCQLRADRFGGLTEHDFEESEILLGVQLAAERVRLAIRSRYASLVEATDTLPEIGGHLERTRIDFVVDADATLGPAEVAFGYAGRFVDYDELGELDIKDSVLRAELRWRPPADEPQQVFVHLDLGKADYDDNVLRTDFGYRTLYAGWRAETPHRSGIELGAGTDAVDEFGVGEVFGLVRFRSGLPARGGRSAVELAYFHGIEPAATADCKTVARIQVRYSEAPRPWLGWSVGLSAGKADYVHPDAGVLPPLLLYSLDAGLQIEIGPPEGAHGRLYATASYESGELPADDYYRWRALAGLAFVY